MTPLVSIIVPTFNAAATLEACLRSIVAQTHPRKEVWVMDAVSTDGTLEIVRRFSEAHPYVRYVSEKDSGVYNAMNKGIAKATGDYLFFMGSDDEFYSNTVLEEVLAAGHGRADLLYGDVLFRHCRAVYSGESSLEKLVGDQASICHQAIFYRRELFERLGGYNEAYFVHADYDFNVRCFEDPSVKTVYLNRIITLYNEHGLSGAQPNKDGFHDWLTLHYITRYSTPFALVQKIKRLEGELKRVKQSGTYRLAGKLGAALQAIKRFGRRG